MHLAKTNRLERPNTPDVLLLLMVDPTRSYLVSGVAVSGILGLAVSFGAIAVGTASEDAVIGLQFLEFEDPTVLAVVTLLGGSVAALLYREHIEQFGAWLDVTVGAILLAQWGAPLSIYLAGGRALTRYNLSTVVLLSFHVLVALAVAVKLIAVERRSTE